MVSLVLAVVLVGGAVQRSHPMLLAWLIWQAGEEQEQTKFDDLRRGITKDWQRVAKFQRTLSKRTKKAPILSDLRF